MNNPVKVLVIGTIAYMIAGGIMKFADEYLGFWLGRKVEASLAASHSFDD